VEKHVKPFGYSYLLDIYGVSAQKCDDIGLCYNYLDKLVDSLGMHKQAPPFIFRSPEGYGNSGGLSGWCALIESNLSIHTMSKTGFISIDVYSCREFDTNGVAEFTHEFFDFKDLEEKFITRGEKYYA
jgi:S-adenosylmethionine decarboxylase